jgi:hypothetical protein
MEPQYRRPRPDLGCSAIGWMDENLLKSTDYGVSHHEIGSTLCHFISLRRVIGFRMEEVSRYGGELRIY